MFSDAASALVHEFGGLFTAFLFVLARAGAVAVFFPIPWSRPAPNPVKAFLALALALVLLPSAAPHIAPAGKLSFIHLAGEAAIGLTIGAVISWLNEIVLVATQIASGQAGFSFASTIDPTTQADSTVLQLLGQLMAGLLLVALGTDRELVRLIARSFEVFPPGAFEVHPGMVTMMIEWAGQALVFAVRLALPLVVLLGIIDLILAMTSRLQPQLQLLTLAFPVKILVSIAVLAASAAVYVRVLAEANVKALAVASNGFVR
jgi:flagellar biosynthetic protein FliR